MEAAVPAEVLSLLSVLAKPPADQLTWSDHTFWRRRISLWSSPPRPNGGAAALNRKGLRLAAVEKQPVSARLEEKKTESAAGAPNV